MSNPESTTNDLAADALEAKQPVNRAPLRSRRPAEVTTFLVGVAVIAVALGVNLTEELLLAGLAVVTGLPTVVTWIVGIWREALRGLGE